MPPVLVALALSCASDPGQADIGNGDHAPWEFSSPSAVLWTEDPYTDGESGEALLLLTTGETDCDALTGSFAEDSLAVLGRGTGLAFFVSYDLQREASVEPDWTGFYMGQDYDLPSHGQNVRFMGVLAFHEGTAYILGSDEGGGAWLRLDRADDEAVEGSFYAVHWWGGFTADDCGPWDTRPYGTGDSD